MLQLMFKVVDNGNGNYVMEWLEADGSPKGTARPATPQEYQMYLMLDVSDAAQRTLYNKLEVKRADADRLEGQVQMALTQSEQLARFEPEDRRQALADIMKEYLGTEVKTNG